MIVAIIIIVVLLKLVFAIIAIGPYAVYDAHQEVMNDYRHKLSAKCQVIWRITTIDSKVKRRVAILNQVYILTYAAAPEIINLQHIIDET